MVGAGWECKYSNGWPSWLSALSNVWIGGLLWILQALLLWIVDTFEETLTYQWIPLKPEMEKMCLHLLDGKYGDLFVLYQSASSCLV